MKNFFEYLMSLENILAAGLSFLVIGVLFVLFSKSSQIDRFIRGQEAIYKQRFGDESRGEYFLKIRNGISGRLFFYGMAMSFFGAIMIVVAFLFYKM